MIRRSSSERRCRNLVHQLDMPTPFRIEGLVANVAARRGRPIHMQATDLKAAPCGLWVAHRDADYIYYEAQTTPRHQAHIVAHELGHMELDHDGQPVFAEELASLIAPHLDPALIRRVLGRGSYSQEAEREAETFASLVMERAERHSGAEVDDPGVAAVVGRLACALEGRRTWHG